MTAPGHDKGETAGGGHDKSKQDTDRGDGKHPHDSSNRKERQGDSDGIPRGREEQPRPRDPKAEDPSNRAERGDRTPYDQLDKSSHGAGDSAGGGFTTSRSGGGMPSKSVEFPKSKAEQYMDKLRQQKNPSE